MFSVTVRDHMMIAHSFTRRGVRARRSGCTARRTSSTPPSAAPSSTPTASSSTSAAPPTRCTRCWASSTYRNLDDEPELAGHEHHDRGAGQAGRRPAAPTGDGARPTGARRDRRHPARVARRVGELRACRCDDGPRRRARTGSTTRPAQRRQPLRPPGLRRARRARLDGARARRRRPWPRPAAALAALARLARIPDGALVLRRRADRLRGPRGARAARRTGCGWSCSCTCRSATHATPRGAREPPCSPARPSSPPATGPGAGWWSCTAAGRPRARGRARRRRRRRLRDRDARRRRLLCVGAVTPGKGHDVLLDGARDGWPTCPGAARASGSLDRDPRFVDGCGRRGVGRADRVRFTGPRTGAELRPRVRRRRPARAPLARGDLRHGRDRGPGPRPAGSRLRRRRRD